MILNKQRNRIHQLYDVMYNIDKIYENYAKSKGVGYNEMLLFYILLEENTDIITQKQICDELEIPKTTLNSIIKNLLNKNLITLKPNENNKKEKFVILTTKGQEYANQLILPLFKIEEEAIQQISDHELELIQKIQNTFGEYLKKELNL